MSTELEVLKEISKKLDQMLILSKLSNRDTLEEFKKKIRGDKVFGKILDFSDGSLTSSDLQKKVAKKMGVAEITVRKKISELREMGFLVAKKEGREVYYEKSDLFD